jgi:Tfp pilus assembly protein PilF
LASYQLYDDAIKLTEEALNNDPTAPSLYRLLGNLYSDAGQPQLAQQNYKIAADFARKIADSSEVEKAEVALAQLIASFPQQ